MSKYFCYGNINIVEKYKINKQGGNEMLEHINKPMFVMGGGINYLLDNINYINVKYNYKDKFSKGLNYFVVFIFTTNIL